MEQRAAGLQGAGSAGEPVNADREQRVVGGVERLLRAAGVGEPPADVRGEVRCPPAPRPDHGRARRAQLRQRLDGAAHVRVADVAEHPDQQHQVSRGRPDVGRPVPGVNLLHRDPAQIGVAGRRPRHRHVARVLLEQRRPDTVRVRPARENTNQIPSLPRAHTHHRQRPTRPLVQPPGDVPLHQAQSAGQLRARVRVRPVPRHPVPGPRHPRNVPAPTDRTRLRQDTGAGRSRPAHRWQGQAMADLPDVGTLAAVADTGLHPAVHAWVPRPARLDALREELSWQVDVAGRDLDWARDFAAHQPASGEPAEMFLNRWLPAAEDLTVLAGPRYEGRNPNRPFVDVAAADRLPNATDLPALRRLARERFTAFRPLDIRVWTADPPDTWPGTRAEMRLVAAPLGQLRRRKIPEGLTIRPAADLSWYDRYVAVHDRHITADPAHADRSRVETAADLGQLRIAGTLFEVLVDGNWAGVLAAEPAVAHGLRGATIVVLLLSHEVRGRGLGQHLSVLLARNLPMPDDQVLHGTIHVDNRTARRSALAARRVDVGGRVVIPLTR